MEIIRSSESSLVINLIHYMLCLIQRVSNEHSDRALRMYMSISPDILLSLTSLLLVMTKVFSKYKFLEFLWLIIQ